MRTKLMVPAALLIALSSIAVLLAIYFQYTRIVEERFGSLDAAAMSIQDKIDRTLFERYGDVQAFTLNTVVHRDLTKLTDSQRKEITQTINNYVTSYGCYSLSLVLDPSGKVVAVNTVDAKGSPLPRAEALLGKDLSANDDFRNAKDGRFSTHSAPGALTGTAMGKPNRDALVASVHGDKAPSWTMTFTAPIKAPTGETLGYWQNYFSEEMVESIVAGEYPSLLAQNMKSASMSVLDGSGNIIMDIDPEEHGHLKNHREDNFSDNQLKVGMPLAVKALSPGAPNHYHETFYDKYESDKYKRSITHSASYAKSEPTLGFVGSGFVTIVRMEKAEFLQLMLNLIRTTAIAGVVSLILGVSVLWFVTGSIVAGVLRVRNAIVGLAAGDISKDLDDSGRDEVADMARSFNEARNGLKSVFGIDQLDWPQIAAQRKEVARLTSVVENSPVNIMVGDTNLKIVYINPAAKRTLANLEQHLPVRANQMIGQSIEVFHKDPAQQRKLLADTRNFPIQSQFKLGNETISLSATAILDAEGSYLGPMVSWEVITKRVEAETREKEMTENLKKTLDIVAHNSHALASASEELTAVSQQMSTYSGETSAQSSVVAAAAEQVTRNVETVATSAEEMTASVKEIAKNATEAARVATNAVHVADQTNKTVGKLGDSSSEIGKVIKTITSIAEQTNLLALNATIEAARAGEMGKGFAVVANEVKELAKQTALATEDISQKIEAIQNDTKGAVVAINEISQIINQINDIQNSIASAVEEQTATTNEIARNASEAAKGSGEISKNITNVSSAARSTSEGAANTLSAANELARLAADLKRVVEQAAQN